jgi:small subunit ribosomal protein S6
MRPYEAVFIVSPVLNEVQLKEVADKFKKILEQNGADVYHEENWGLRKLAYPIEKKTTGFYLLFEFKAAPQVIATLETEFRRDERVLRFLTVSLDKYAVEYNEKRRKGHFNKAKKEQTATAPVAQTVKQHDEE